MGLLCDHFRSQRSGCACCAFSCASHLCPLNDSCDLRRRGATFFGFWGTTTATLAAVTAMSPFALLVPVRVLRARSAPRSSPVAMRALCIKRMVTVVARGVALTREVAHLATVVASFTE